MGVVGRWRPGVFGETADMCENSCFFPQKMGSGIVVMLLVAAVGPRDGFELEYSSSKQLKEIYIFLKLTMIIIKLPFPSKLTFFSLLC